MNGAHPRLATLVVASLFALAGCSSARCHAHRTAQSCEQDLSCFPVFRCPLSTIVGQRCREGCTPGGDGICGLTTAVLDGCYLDGKANPLTCRSFDGRADRCASEPLEKNGTLTCLDTDPPCGGCSQGNLDHCAARPTFSL